MAMTKKERAEFDEALRQARILGALRWSEPVKPDLDIPQGSTIQNGWLYNAYSGTVEKACTSGSFHAIGQWDKTTSQHPRRLYSTRLLALKALRYEMARNAAEALAKVDQAIAEATQNPGVD